VLKVIKERVLNYRLLRGIQISFVFFLIIFIQELWRFPHAGWCGFTAMMIYAGFDNGTTVVRVYHRFLGVVLGVLLGYMIWYVARYNYRLWYFIVPGVVYGIFFWNATVYAIPTIHTVCASIFAFGYYDTQSSFVISYFVMDYLMATLIGFSVIMFVERVWFSRDWMMRRFLRDTQEKVINELQHLIILWQQEKIRHMDWFSCCERVDCYMDELNRLLDNMLYEIGDEKTQGGEFDRFVTLTNRIILHLKALYCAYWTKQIKQFDCEQLETTVKSDWNKLKMYLIELPIPGSMYGIKNIKAP